VNGLPDRLYSADAVRELERRACAHRGITPGELMERAGAAALAALSRRWPAARSVAVVCGAGNNGGDGYVLARLAREQGLDVTVHAIASPTNPSGDAAAAARRYGDVGGVLHTFAGAPITAADVIVDGIFGIGLVRPVQGAEAAAITAINDAGRPVLALDVPSGLEADTGRVLGTAVHAQLTVTFLALKAGFFTGAGPAHAGLVELAQLGCEAAEGADPAPVARLISHGRHPFPLPRRRRDAHKGECGHVLVIGGDHGMAGASLLAGEAAARVGAGLVTVATRPEHARLQLAARPELMVAGVEGPAQLEPLLDHATVVAVGPGLGQGDWGARLLACVLESRLARVLDADALNLLARDPVQYPRWVLTPHPGEAARLLGCTSADIQRDRFAAVQALRDRYGGTVVLKGAGSLIAGARGDIAVCTDGNPGMASGGMGDVLTGVIAGLIAQGLDQDSAAEAGVCLHGAAADGAAAEGGERGLLARDLMPWLRRLANPAP
jgi:ADP-dependent NAD(P)H-hydrate dehydratase / NAD(P)H-hydrate epimerase